MRATLITHFICCQLSALPMHPDAHCTGMHNDKRASRIQHLHNVSCSVASPCASPILHADSRSQCNSQDGRHKVHAGILFLTGDEQTKCTYFVWVVSF